MLKDMERCSIAGVIVRGGMVRCRCEERGMGGQAGVVRPSAIKWNTGIQGNTGVPSRCNCVAQ